MLRAVATQNQAAAAITGGTINGTVIGGTTPAAITGTTVTSNSEFLATDGSVSAPGYGFTAEANTGLYRPQNGVVRMTLTGVDVFSYSANGLIQSAAAALRWGSSGITSPDVFLVRDGAAILASRNGGVPQSYRIYNTYTDASNNEYAAITWSSNQINFNAVKTGTGTQRNVGIATNGGRVLVGAPTDDTTTKLQVAGAIAISDTKILRSTTTFSNGAAAAAGTLLNAPAAGNPTKWIPIDDNGTTRYIPAW